MRTRAPYVIAAVVVALLVAFGLRQCDESRRERGVFTGTIEAEESRIGSKVGGRVVATPVREGGIVRKGDLIVALESDELEAALNAAVAAEQQARERLRDLEAGPRPQEIERAQATLDQARSQLDKLKHGSRPQEKAAAKAAVEQARQRLKLMQAGPRKEEVDKAKAAYEAAKAEATLARQSLERIEKLYKDGAVSAQNLDDARTRASVTGSQEESARRQLDELRAGNRPEDIAAAREALRQTEANAELVLKGPREEDIRAAEAAAGQSRAALAELKAGTRPYQVAQARSALKQARANVDQVQAKFRERAVYTPRAGQLLVLSVQVGDIVAAGQPIGTIVDPRDLFVKLYVPEKDIRGWSVGDRVPGLTDSGVRVTGTIEAIPVQAEFTPRNVQTKEERALQVYAVKIRLTNPKLKLRAGMSIDVRLER